MPVTNFFGKERCLHQDTAPWDGKYRFECQCWTVHNYQGLQYRPVTLCPYLCGLGVKSDGKCKGQTQCRRVGFATIIKGCISHCAVSLHFLRSEFSFLEWTNFLSIFSRNATRTICPLDVKLSRGSVRVDMSLERSVDCRSSRHLIFQFRHILLSFLV